MMVPLLALCLLGLHGPIKPTVTIVATLKASSKVPDPKAIAPYKNALVSGDYTVTKIVSGKDSNVKLSQVVRVFRLGIAKGALTGLSKVKKGSKVTLALKPLNDWPEMQREFQTDELPVTDSTFYFVEVPK